MDDLHCVRLDASMVHPSPLSPPVFRSVDRNWDESEARARFLFSAVSHQLISVMDKNKKEQLKFVRVPIHRYMYRHRFPNLVEEVSFKPAGSHSRQIIRLVGFLSSLRASSPFSGSRQVHARAARERKHDSAGPPARAFSRGSFPSPKWRACSQANSCSAPHPSLCRHKIEYKALLFIQNISPILIG